jgi:hypothetical protein
MRKIANPPKKQLKTGHFTVFFSLRPMNTSASSYKNNSDIAHPKPWAWQEN